ncbi:MAG: glycosyltransferase family 2 protein [Anaerolineaceae bacterium]|nr:glycosyltransferase family 2 protein [Anaerolineaceae bacterium]
MSPTLSFIIPVYNEEESIEELFAQIQQSCGQNGYDRYEVIFIDDGSTDGSTDKIRAIISQSEQQEKPEKVTLIRFRKNFGKAAALQAGFEKATGEIAITMDADLQDDPFEIPKLLAKMDEGFDVVSGWKQVRHDPMEKRIPSKLFNWVTAKMSGIHIHDFNCGFKAYRQIVYRNLNLYGEMHRYIPIQAKRLGFSTGETAVEHHARKHGHSKYGFERYLRGLFDSMTSSFLLHYGDRPMHFFGRPGLLMCGIGIIICLILTVQWLGGQGIGTRPLLALGILLITVGFQFFATGLSCEMMLDRLGNRGSNPTRIAEVITSGKPKE